MNENTTKYLQGHIEMLARSAQSRRDLAKDLLEQSDYATKQAERDEAMLRDLYPLVGITVLP